MCVDMHVDMRCGRMRGHGSQTCAVTCAVGMCMGIDTHKTIRPGLYVRMRTDVCVDTCVDICVPKHVHASRPMGGHVCRRM